MEKWHSFKTGPFIQPERDKEAYAVIDSKEGREIIAMNPLRVESALRRLERAILRHWKLLAFLALVGLVSSGAVQCVQINPWPHY